MRTKTNKLNQTLSLYLAVLLALFCLPLAGCGGLALKEKEYEQTGRMIPYISRLDEEKTRRWPPGLARRRFAWKN
ncbi:MAG: hypothetical protein ACLUO4_00230 [Christensenellales bacterium]